MISSLPPREPDSNIGVIYNVTQMRCEPASDGHVNSSANVPIEKVRSERGGSPVGEDHTERDLSWCQPSQSPRDTELESMSPTIA